MPHGPYLEFYIILHITMCGPAAQCKLRTQTGLGKKKQGRVPGTEGSRPCMSGYPADADGVT
ncbi:MAG: hypothetical protein Alpg2KO_09500 [Alphaproteobacteria bacterium]